MRAELKYLEWPDDLDPDADLSGALPIEVTTSIGVLGEEGADLFRFVVSTTEGLENELEANGKPIFLRHYLLVKELDRSVVEERIADLLRSFEGPDWGELGPKIARYGYWEFEDYSIE